MGQFQTFYFSYWGIIVVVELNRVVILLFFATKCVLIQTNYLIVSPVCGFGFCVRHV